MSVLTITFWILAVWGIASALMVVHTRDIFRAALFLVSTFIAVAGFFVILGAEFLAVVQVLVYAGGISVLIIFAVMFTREVAQGNQPNRYFGVGLLLGAALFLVLAFTVISTNWFPEFHDTSEAEAIASGAFSDTSGGLGTLLREKFILPFELTAILLLAVLVGAVALVKER